MTKLDPISKARLTLLRRRLREMGLLIGILERDVIHKRDPEALVPLTYNQEGLWFIHQLTPDQPNYNIPGTLQLAGRLHVEALRCTLETIVHRHEALRTSFKPTENGLVVQVIHPRSRFELPIRDLSALSPGDYADKALRIATREARSPFDLKTGPLFRAFLIRRSDTEHILVFNMHHIISDGWSLGVFRDEMKLLYEAYSNNQSNPLADLPVQYGDYAIWERTRLPEKKLDLAYWKNNLTGAPAEIDLPADLPRPPLLSYNGAHHPLDLGTDFSEFLRQTARQEGMTLHVFLKTAFDILLALLSNQKELVVGTGIANRDLGEVENLIGFFVRILPLRISMQTDPTFRSLLGQVREATINAITHQLPLSMLVKEMQPSRDPSRNPFFQVEFTMLTPDVNPAIFGSGISKVDEHIQMDALYISPFEVEGGVSRFDLAVFLWDSPQGLSGTVEYCADLFLVETIRKWIALYKNILQLTSANPDMRVSQIAAQVMPGAQPKKPKIDEAARSTLRQKFSRAKRKSIGVEPEG